MLSFLAPTCLPTQYYLEDLSLVLNLEGWMPLPSYLPECALISGFAQRAGELHPNFQYQRHIGIESPKPWHAVNRICHISARVVPANFPVHSECCVETKNEEYW